MPGIVKIAFLADVGAAKVGLTQFASDTKSTVDKVGETWGKLKDKLKVGALAGGAAVGAALAEGIDVEAARDKLSAQLGLVGPDAAKVGKAAGDLFAGAYGDSMESVNDTLRAAIQNGVVSIKAARPELKAVGADIENYITLTGEDAQATTRAVAQIMKNNLAPNAKRAFDLLVTGVQQGVDKSNDLLDTFTEYSTEFRALGLDGPKALGLLSQGLKAGARDADTVADALKEFAIRAKDGSKTTVDGFKSIGLNADKMQQVFAKGGPGAAAGLDLVLDKIRAIKDPAEQSRVAVELFGTKSEDLQAALLALDPSTAVQGLGQVAGAADRVNDTLGDNAKSKITAWKRRFQVDVVNFIGDDVLPELEKLSGWFTTNIGPKIEEFKTKVTPKAKEALGELKQLWADNKDELGELAENVVKLADGLQQKVIPAAQDAYPILKNISELDLSNTITTVKGLNTLLSKGDGTAEGPSGVIAKIKSLGTIAATVNPVQHLTKIALDSVFQFGEVFAKDGTVRAKIAGWIGRNFGSLAGLLPTGQLSQAGAIAAQLIGKAFGAQNPAGSVAKFMATLGGAIIRNNPVEIARKAGQLLATRIDQGLLGGQPTVVGRAAAFAKNVGGSLISALPGGAVFAAGVGLGGKLSTGIRDGISKGVSKITGFVRGLPSTIAKAGGDFGGALVGAGRAVIEGLISGIRSKIPSLGGVLGDVTGFIASHKGPIEKDRVLLTPAGEAIMQGLIRGIESQLPDLKRTLSGVTGQIDGLSADPTVTLSATSLLPSVSSVSDSLAAPVINVYALTAGPEVGRQVMTALKEYEAINGTSWRTS